MIVTTIATPLIEPRQSLLPILIHALPRPLRERDIVCVTSKIVALEQGRRVDLSTVKPSSRALELLRSVPAARHPLHPGLAELIVREADAVWPGDPVWLTVKDGIFVANAGIDLSNAPDGHATLLPLHPWDWACDMRQRLRQIYQVNELGLLITDTRCIPLRRGMTGVALAFCGFEGLESQKGKLDLFGRPLQFTQKSVADDLATAAVLVSGEAGESTPFVLIEDAPAVFTERRFDTSDLFVSPDIDMFQAIYGEDFFRRMADQDG